MDNDYIYGVFGGIFGDIFGVDPTKSYESALDELWMEFKIAEYNNKLNEAKKLGYKIYRNSKGNHRVMRNG